MAKKSRRVKEGRKAALSAAQMVQPRVDETGDAVVVRALAATVPQATNLQDEYRYVIADLKRIGVIAVAMLAVLVILALLLT